QRGERRDAIADVPTTMKVLLITESPARDHSEPDSPAQALRELGCDVRSYGFDLSLDEDDLGKDPPQVLVLDARARLASAYACLKTLRSLPPLETTPALVTVTTGRLSSLDFRAADDFVLVPVVAPELYARMRQLDWRLSAFAADEQMKVGDLVIDLAGYE